MCNIFNQIKHLQNHVIRIELSVSTCFRSHDMFFHCWCQPNCSTNALPDSRENSDLQSVQVCWQTKLVNKLTPVQSLKSNETADTLTNCTASMCFVTACGLWHWITLETATRPYFSIEFTLSQSSQPLNYINSSRRYMTSVWHRPIGAHGCQTIMR